MDWSDYLTNSENKFYKAFYGKYDSLSEKQQARYEKIEEKLMEKIDNDASKTMDKMFKDWKKTIGKTETDTKDGWSMRFFQFVDDAGYSIVDGSNTAEYYKNKRGGAATHVMPDGTVHTGKVHTKNSRVVAGACP